MDYKGPIEAALTSDLRGDPYNFSLWDVHTGTQLVVFKGNKSNPISKCLKFIDNNYFITAVDNVLQIWSIYNRKCQDQKLFLPGRPSVICISPCGNYLIVGISEMIYIWQLRSGNLLTHTQRHYQTVSVLKLNHEGTFLISGGEDGMVLVWPFADLVSGTCNTGGLNLSNTSQDVGVNEPRFTWQNHSAQVTDLHITDSLKCITCSVDSTVNIYSYMDGKRLFCVNLPSPIWSVVMDRNETSIYLGGQDGKIYQIVTSSISLSQINSQREEASQKPIFIGHESKVTSLIISIDGSKLMSASNDSSVKIWDIYQKKMLQDIKHQAPLANLTTVIVPDSFALTSMTQSQTKPPLSVKPLKRQLYKPPRDGTVSSSDLFEESSTTIVNVKNKPCQLHEQIESKDVVEKFDIAALEKFTSKTNGSNQPISNQLDKVQVDYREKLRDLYLVAAEKIFHDSAAESLKPYKPTVDEIIATNGLPHKNPRKTPNNKTPKSKKVKTK